MSVGLRAGLLTRMVAGPPVPAAGTAVIIVGDDDSVKQTSTGAEDRLADLVGGDSMADPVSVIAALVGAARRFARGEVDTPPRSRALAQRHVAGAARDAAEPARRPAATSW